MLRIYYFINEKKSCFFFIGLHLFVDHIKTSLDRLMISSTFFAKIILFLGLIILDVSKGFSHSGIVFSKKKSFHVEI